MVEIMEGPPDGERFEAVLALAKRAKRTVGFLPDSAFAERAGRGTLLIAVDSGSVVAYCLYDLPRDEIRIRHLVTAEEAQGLGLARALVDEICTRHPARRGILLDCRRDYEVAGMWPKLGFIPVAERAGRSAEQLPLTTWVRDFGHPNLLTLTTADDERLVAALDANIVIDLADGAATTSERLTADWIQNSVRFAVTDEARVEINRQDDQITRERHFQALGKYDHLPASRDSWRHLLADLKAQIGTDAYDSDLTHAAQAAAGGARWLVTQDGNFRRRCAALIREMSGLDVVSPGQLLVELDQILRGDEYRPSDLAGSDLEIRDIRADEFESVAEAFLNQREGERLARLRAELEGLGASAKRRLRVLVDGDNYLGAIAELFGSVHRLAMVRVARSGPQTTIARQLLAMARREAAQRAVPLLLIDAHCGESVRKAATAEGFVPAGPTMVAFPVEGFGTPDDLEQRVRRLAASLPPEVTPVDLERLARTTGAAASKEEAFAPWRLMTDDLPTFVVPINPAWAAELFDIDIARSTLFGRHRGLAFQREHVYYRSTSATGGLTAPGRILWYVKRGPSNGPGIRAVSSLREVVVGSPSRLHRRFAHLGVFTEAQVREVAGRDRVMALRFTHSEMLHRPIALDEYRREMAAVGSPVVLQSPQRLPERMFERLISMAQ